MRYIRTKDGVYELKVNEELKAQKTSNYFYINDKRFACNLLLDKQYVKKCRQADTIEELCDYFIYNEYEQNGGGKLIFRKVFHGYEKDQLKNIMLDGGGNIKLGILTDKGLIYVAKINDKGEVELL